ncbi:MAG TPA: transglutaminase-like domain-containing protein [Thermoanaerobaculia bacterium]|jgi:hypothetical protein|nr:transglutaminase-like domain-containing protein [Thermoanaerobaculia bacterium]
MRKTGILARMMRAVTLMRSTSCVVIAALMLMVVQPGLVRAQGMPRAKIVEPTPRSLPSNVEAGVAERLGRTLADVSRLEKALSAEPSADLAKRAERIDGVRKRLENLAREVNAGFNAVDAMLKKANLPRVIEERQAEAREGYRKQMETLLDGLSVAEKSGSPEEQARALRSLLALAKQTPPERPHQRLDPNNLPVNRPVGKVRAPATTPEEFKSWFKDLKVDVKAARQPMKLAAAAVAPQPADLQPTEDVQITPEIQALAFELGNNPLRIYNWVYDNVELIPTYGSIRGSQMTLLTKRGNAFDISSLLIALLRASNVPARYVLGTAQVPVDKLANALGGTENAEVTQQLLGQGGIPNVGLLQNGQITQIRVEHVWVEAWVDYIPGRGAKAGPGDTWVPLDASLKKHDVIADSGLLGGIPFDMSGFANNLLQGAQVDPALGRVNGIDVNVAYDAVENWQLDLTTYAEANSIPSTQDALLGKSAIAPSGAKVLPASLPYQVLVRAAAISALPNSLRLGVKLTGYASSFDRAFGSPSFTYHVSLPALGNRRLSLTFPPATDADAQVIQSAVANNASSLPVYLINVKPSITLDGTVVASGAPVRMGTFHFVDVLLEDPAGSATVPYQVVAGDESVIGLNGDGIDAAAVEDRFNRVPVDTAAENLQQVALHYWSECDGLDALAAKGLKVHALRRFSVGLFSTPLSVAYLFGSPRSGIYQSRIMDVKRSFVGVAGSTDDLTRAFVRSSGRSGSFLEGSVFDQLFDRPQGRGVSAMQLLLDASLGGIALYHVTSDNVAAVMPLLRLPAAVKADISAAVSQGKTVMVSESEIQHDNYRGVGYIVEDPVTGAAAYLISGGLAGGGLFDCHPELVPILIFILSIIILALLLWWLWPAIAAGLAWLGGLLGGGVGAPAFASLILAIIGLFVTTAPASAQSPGGGGGGVDPATCKCRPCDPNPPCEVDDVVGGNSRKHWPCPGDHWHFYKYNQVPYPDCRCFLSKRQFGACIPPPMPVPCPP